MRLLDVLISLLLCYVACFLYCGKTLLRKFSCIHKNHSLIYKQQSGLYCLLRLLLIAYYVFDVYLLTVFFGFFGVSG